MFFLIYQLWQNGFGGFFWCLFFVLRLPVCVCLTSVLKVFTQYCLFVSCKEHGKKVQQLIKTYTEKQYVTQKISLYSSNKLEKDICYDHLNSSTQPESSLSCNVKSSGIVLQASWRTFKVLLWMLVPFCSIMHHDYPTLLQYYWSQRPREDNPWLIGCTVCFFTVMLKKGSHFQMLAIRRCPDGTHVIG